MDAAIDEWRATGKVARVWAHDATVWTGNDEDAWLGWLGVALDHAAHAHRFEELIEEVRDAQFTDAVVLGMGGSSLCPDVLAHTFTPQPGFPRLYVLDATDPAQVKAIEESVNLTRTLFFVSSKSGTTLEPNIFAAYFTSTTAFPTLLAPTRLARTSWRSPTPALPSKASHGDRDTGTSSMACRRSAVATRPFLTSA